MNRDPATWGLEYLDPTDFGLTPENLDYRTPIASDEYCDWLRIVSPRLLVGYSGGKYMSYDTMLGTLTNLDHNLRTIFYNNGYHGLYHIVDYSTLPLSSGKGKKMSKEYFDCWFNEGILKHQAVVGLPAMLEPMAALLEKLNPKQSRSFHKSVSDALEHVQYLIDQEEYRYKKYIPLPEYDLIGEDYSVQYYKVKEGVILRKTTGNITQSVLEKNWPRQRALVTMLQWKNPVVVSDTREVGSIGLDVRIALAWQVLDEEFPFSHVYLLGNSLTTLAAKIIMMGNKRLAKKVTPVKSVEEALSTITKSSHKSFPWKKHFLPFLYIKDLEKKLDFQEDLNRKRMNYLYEVLGQISWDTNIAIDAVKPDEDEFMQQVWGAMHLLQSDLLKLLQEKEEVVVALEEARKNAEFEAMQKSDFLAVMSHEIRTPLNVLIGISKLLIEEDPKPEQVELLDTLHFSAESLLHLINDILDFSKIGAGKLELENISFCLSQLLKRLKTTFDLQVQEKQLTFNLVVPSKELWVVGDSTRISQIVNNLLSNAIKFTEEGTVEVGVEVLEYESNASEIALRLWVSDSGIGIAKENHKAIFEQFTQASRDTTRKFGGTGLGLAIIKKLVEVMNGHIELNSSLGEGSTFSVYLTFPKAKHTTVETVLELESRDWSSKRILLVDDIAVNRLVAKKILEKWGVSVEEASSGKEAISFVMEHHVDLILMDLQMPDMDGYETTKEILREYPYIPIIALSANVFADIETKVFDSGMVDYLTKPLKIERLREVLIHYLFA